MTYVRRAAWATLIALSAAMPLTQADPLQLPDMGASASTVFSPQKEKEVGREIMRSLRRSGHIIDAPFLNDYVQRLGYRLAAAATAESNYTFFILDDPSINAFALPGGYVGINAGLVIAARSESELAGVIAHEISHVTQHHLARRLEESSKMDIPMMAALLAAIVLGQQDPQMGQAAVAGAMAGSSQAQLDFTRAHEQEADRIGMAILAQAGFDPEGMPTFFERLYQETRYTGGESAELEFLRTHPVTVSRIADSRNRARQYPKPKLAKSDLDYEFAKAVLQVRVGRDPEATLRQFKAALGDGRYQHAQAIHLGMALVLLELRRPAEARAHLETAIGSKDPSPLLLSTKAQIERSEGNTRNGEKILKRGLALYPENGTLTFDYARLLIDAQRFQEASALMSAFVRGQENAKAYALLAEAQNGLGKSSASHMAQAERYALLDEIPLAMDQLRLARKDPDADFYTLSRIEARLSELESLLPKKSRSVE